MSKEVKKQRRGPNTAARAVGEPAGWAGILTYRQMGWSIPGLRCDYPVSRRGDVDEKGEEEGEGEEWMDGEKKKRKWEERRRCLEQLPKHTKTGQERAPKNNDRKNTRLFFLYSLDYSSLLSSHYGVL